MDIVRSETFSRYPSVVFGMSTRNRGDGTRELRYSTNSLGDELSPGEHERRKFFEHLGIEEQNIAVPLQLHTANVVVVHAPGRYPDSDALLTGVKSVFLVVSVADCVPIFLFDPVTVTVSGIHAGWRGTSKLIAARALEMMKRERGVDPKNVLAFVGPAAGRCCYEVGDEVAALFGNEFVVREKGKALLDLKSVNQRHLLDGGIPLAQIEVHPSCTICTPERFHSYRRDRERSGRMLAVIGIVEG